MNSNIQFVGTDRNDTAEGIIMKRLNKITDKYDFLIRAEVIFKKDKDAKGKGNICEIQVSLPGPLIFASANEESLEAAAAEAADDLERQLRKRKGTIQQKR